MTDLPTISDTRASAILGTSDIGERCEAEGI